MVDAASLARSLTSLTSPITITITIATTIATTVRFPPYPGNKEPPPPCKLVRVKPSAVPEHAVDALEPSRVGKQRPPLPRHGAGFLLLILPRPLGIVLLPRRELWDSPAR